MYGSEPEAPPVASVTVVDPSRTPAIGAATKRRLMCPNCPATWLCEYQAPSALLEMRQAAERDAAGLGSVPAKRT